MASDLDSTFAWASADVDDPEHDAAPVLTLMWHPDPTRIGERFSLPRGSTELSRYSPMFAALGSSEGRPLDCRHVSRRPVAITRSERFVELRGDILVNGTSAQQGVCLHAAELSDGATLELGHYVVLLAHLAAPTEPGPSEAETYGLVGTSDAMRRLRADIRRAGRSRASVLIRGESGSGKELVARAIHDASSRAKGPYQAINVSAVPAELAASAFFGHVRGAFSGAHQAQPGYFETCTGGTLFLDEIGDLPIALQPMLLRALELGEIQPVGTHTPRTIDVRIIAATDASLESEMEAKCFSRALYHRLAGLELQVPALHARRSDITQLLYFGLERELRALEASDRLELPGPSHWLDAHIIALLCRYMWPGNVRELLNLARQLALVGSVRERPRVRDLPALERIAQALMPVQPASPAVPASVTPSVTPSVTQDAAPEPQTESAAHGPEADKLATLDEELVRAALRAAHWSIPMAARELGVAKSTLYRFIDQHALLRKASDIPDSELLDAWRLHAGDRLATSDELQVSPRALALRLSKLELD